MSQELTTKIEMSKLDESLHDISNNIANETDPAKVKDMVELFNWSMSKKNTARLTKLSEIYDKVTAQMDERITLKADQFSHSDLIDYLKVIQGAMDTSSKNLTSMETPPAIIHNNTQINVNVVDSFDRDSRERILAAIQATLSTAARSTQDIIEVDATSIEEKGDTPNEQ